MVLRLCSRGFWVTILQYYIRRNGRNVNTYTGCLTETHTLHTYCVNKDIQILFFYTNYIAKHKIIFTVHTKFKI